MLVPGWFILKVMAITRFEDIEAWQMARKLSQQIYALVYEGALQKDFSLKDQIRDSRTENQEPGTGNS